MYSYAIGLIIYTAFVHWTQTSLLNTSICTNTRWPTNCTSQAEFVQQLRSEGYIKTNRVAEVMTNFDRKYYVPYNPYSDVCDLLVNETKIYDSPPRMHAFALEVLEKHLKKGNKVLEIGYGSGYLTACMGLMVGSVGHVIAIDEEPAVCDVALSALEHDPYYKQNDLTIWIKFVAGDVKRGDPKEGPYNVIYISLADPQVPASLMEQLAKGGRLVMTVGDVGPMTEIHIYDKDLEGNVTLTKRKGNFYAPRPLVPEEPETESEYVYNF